jgi:hypothetical protein
MEQIDRLTIIEALRDVKARYCRLADYKDWDGLSELFTQDGSVRFYNPNGELRAEAIGRAAIAGYIRTSVALAQPIHHVFSAEFQIVSRSEASAVWAMEDRLIQPDGASAAYRTMHGFGHYHEHYRLVGDTWLISKLEQTRLKLDFT